MPRPTWPLSARSVPICVIAHMAHIASCQTWEARIARRYQCAMSGLEEKDSTGNEIGCPKPPGKARHVFAALHICKMLSMISAPSTRVQSSLHNGLQNCSCSTTADVQLIS